MERAVAISFAVLLGACGGSAQSANAQGVGGLDATGLVESGGTDAGGSDSGPADAWEGASENSVDASLDSLDSLDSEVADGGCTSTGPIAIPASIGGASRLIASAYGINASGQIVGAYFGMLAGSGNVISGAAFWASVTSNLTPLASGAYPDAISATAINSRGEIVGVASTNFGATSVPVFWSSSTAVPTPLPTGGLTNVSVRGINDNGEIVGTAQAGPLYWANATSLPIALPLGDYAPPNGSAFATGINNMGQIVGGGSIYNTLDAPAVIWSSPTSVPAALPGGGAPVRSAFASGINDFGLIVGMIKTDYPVFWPSPQSQPQPVPTDSSLPPMLVGLSVSGINNVGQLVGTEQVYPDSGIIRRSDVKTFPVYWTVCR
jgi:uncharacterized membrane protein